MAAKYKKRRLIGRRGEGSKGHSDRNDSLLA